MSDYTDLLARLSTVADLSQLDLPTQAAGAIEALQARAEQAETFLERKGYRRCDIPACHCDSWYGGKAERVLELEREARQEREDELKAALAAEREAHERTRLALVRDDVTRLERDEARAALAAEREACERYRQDFRIQNDHICTVNDALTRADALVRSVEWVIQSRFTRADDRCALCGHTRSAGHSSACVLAAYLRDRTGGAA